MWFSFEIANMLLDKFVIEFFEILLQEHPFLNPKAKKELVNSFS